MRFFENLIKTMGDVEEEALIEVHFDNKIETEAL
jgi:hypothetical protein